MGATWLATFAAGRSMRNFPEQFWRIVSAGRKQKRDFLVAPDYLQEKLSDHAVLVFKLNWRRFSVNLSVAKSPTRGTWVVDLVRWHAHGHWSRERQSYCSQMLTTSKRRRFDYRFRVTHKVCSVSDEMTDEIGGICGQTIHPMGLCTKDLW